MAILDTEINANDLPESTGGEFDLIPAGWYTAAITEADLKATKDGSGQYIKLRWDITGPTHQGRVVFQNLNIRNPNPKAEEIGRRELGEVMKAGGLSALRDTDKLIGINANIKIKVRPPHDGYDADNAVNGIKALTGGVPAFENPPPFAAPKAAAKAPAPAAAAAPWARK